MIYKIVDSDWFWELADRALLLEPSLEEIDGMFIDGHQVLGVRGNVDEHNDPAFPEWSYILVLHVDGKSVLYSKTKPLPLCRGMLIELNVWELHELRQPKDHRLIWYPVDCDMRISLDEAENLAHEAFCIPGQYAGVIGH